MLGISIMVFFFVIAIGAPLLTPYSPTSTVVSPKIAYKLSKPVWYKYLFPRENITENVNPILGPYFDTATTIEEFELDTALTNQGSIRLEFEPNIGCLERSGPGCGALVFKRDADITPYGDVKANLSKVFNYPYSSPPQQFMGDVAILVDNPQNMSIRISLVLEKVGSERRIVWTDENFENISAKWIVPDPLVNSDSSATKKWLGDTFGSEWITRKPAAVMFQEPGDYKYGVEITFSDNYPGEDVEATIYIDDFFIKIYGNSFGLFGTDHYNRDIFTQLVYGTQISLTLGILSAIFSVAIGLVIGLAAGYIGGFFDQVLMRFTDLLLVIPDTPLYIILMATLSPGMWTLILLISVLGWTGFARLVRAQTLSLKERPFVEAAKAVGGGKFHVIFRHILPNVMNLVYVTLATSVPYAITTEAWLSWLGLYDPNTMTWGRMLYDVQTEATGMWMWWWVIPPGLCIAAISLAFILLGYALDEVLNPKLRERR
jgi:ABC-type dipeptide/oligopeptide/nickel transport system permease subunit